MTSGKIEVEKFDGDGDYVLWKEKLLAHLDLLGLMEGLEEEDETSTVSEDPDLASGGGSVTPVTKVSDSTEKTLKEKRGKARSTIILSVENHILRKIVKEKTAAGMLRMLDNMFMAKSLPNRIYLKQRLYAYKMSESMSIEENVNDFFKLISDLENVKVTVPEEDQAIVLLMSLPRQFDQLKETLKYCKTTLALEEITGAIRSKTLELGVNGKAIKSNSEALYVQDRGRSEGRTKASDKGKHKSRSKSRGAVKACWVCGKEGHFKKQCFVWKERNKGLNLTEKGEASVAKGDEYQVASLMVSEANFLTSDESNEKWILDTGCTFHMTPRKDWFESLSSSDGGSVKMANDTVSVVKGIGSIRIQNDDGTTILLTNVRYVPTMSKNLISLGTLEESGCWFQSKEGVLKVIKGCRMMMKAVKTDRLYLLKGKVITGEANAIDKSSDETKLWHSRLGHIGQKGLEVLAKKGCLQQCKVNGLEFCEDCVYGKAHRVSFGAAKHTTRDKLEYIHSDLWGSPSVPNTLGNCQYFISFTDDFTRKVWLFLMKKKDEAFTKFVEWKKMVELQTGKKVKRLRTDNGLEFCNHEFDGFCRREGIVRHRTCTYTPQQNGIAERLNRTIMNKVRSMLSESGLGQEFWGEAASTAVFLINRSPSTALDFGIPEEKWTNSLPDYSGLKRFGCVSYVHSDQGKLNPRAKKGVFLGYPTGVKGFRIWLLDEEKCIISRNVVFQEEKVYKDVKEVSGSTDEEQNKTRSVNLEVGEPEAETRHDQGGESSRKSSTQTEEGSESDSSEQDDTDTDEEYFSGDNEDDISQYQLVRDRAKREIRLPRRYAESNAVGLALAMTEDGGRPEPKSYEEAVNDPDWESWKEAMDDEMVSQRKNKTFELVNKPENKKIIGCRWVYKRKYGLLGVKRPIFKARLVAKGYSQKHGVDYQEIFSPVVKHVSIRLLLAAVAQFDMELEQLDVKTAFLHGNLDEYILMSQPEGYEVESKPEKVCLLKRSLYGLKQSPRLWNQRFDLFMVKSGFKRSEQDTCVYFKEISKNQYVYLLLYVDDMLIASKDMNQIKKLKDLLSSEFEMKDMGEAKRILGMEIHRDRSKGVLTLSQGNYLMKVLDTFKLDQCNSVQTPLGVHFKLRAATEKDLKEQEEEMKSVPYASAVGSIMYAMIGTRVDLAYPVGVISRYMSKPLKEHWQAVKWVLRYIKGSTGLKLVFKRQERFVLSGYCDSDFSGELDHMRSTGGYVFTLGGGTISWRSSLQRVVALSTTEAEYMALAEAGKEAVWIKRLMNEMGFHQGAVEVFCDSQSAIALSKNAVFHERTKHVARKFHFIRDLITDGLVKVTKIPTLYNPADILTKVLPVGKLQDALELLQLSKN